MPYFRRVDDHEEPQTPEDEVIQKREEELELEEENHKVEKGKAEENEYQLVAFDLGAQEFIDEEQRQSDESQVDAQADDTERRPIVCIFAKLYDPILEEFHFIHLS
jgi:DNA-binding PucR family transcriptional regulator